MSGGHWNYAGFRLQDTLQEISGDETVKQRWPEIGEAFGRLADALYDIEHAMDWDICGDSMIEDDRTWQANAMERLRVAIHDARPWPCILDPECEPGCCREPDACMPTARL